MPYQLPEIIDEDDAGRMYLALLQYVAPINRHAFTTELTAFYHQAGEDKENSDGSRLFWDERWFSSSRGTRGR